MWLIIYNTIYRAAFKINIILFLLTSETLQESRSSLFTSFTSSSSASSAGTQVGAGARMGETPCLMQPICKSPAALAEAESKS